MNDYAADRAAELREQFPGWCVWWVRSATTRQLVWLAKPADSPVATLAADTPEELAAAIREQDEQ